MLKLSTRRSDENKSPVPGVRPDIFWPYLVGNELSCSHSSTLSSPGPWSLLWSRSEPWLASQHQWTIVNSRVSFQFLLKDSDYSPGERGILPRLGLRNVCYSGPIIVSVWWDLWWCDYIHRTMVRPAEPTSLSITRSDHTPPPHLQLLLWTRRNHKPPSNAMEGKGWFLSSVTAFVSPVW